MGQSKKVAFDLFSNLGSRFNPAAYYYKNTAEEQQQYETMRKRDLFEAINDYVIKQHPNYMIFSTELFPKCHLTVTLRGTHNESKIIRVSYDIVDDKISVYER